LFAGHVGVALAIGRVERRVNVGIFVTAALLLDFVLWLFILLGWESVSIPDDFAATHQPRFVFPYSHGLLAAGGWSALGGALALWLYSPRDNMPVALVVEAGIVALGMCIFLPGSRLARGKSVALGVLILIILMFTVIGMTVAPPPLSAPAMAGSSLIVLVVVCELIGWLGRLPRERKV
jgi:hypothetical protein